MSDCEIHWPLPPNNCALAATEVHVWAACLDQPAARLAMLKRTPAADERERAHRFHSELDRNRFIAGRGLLRAVLGRYLQTDASQVVFNYGPNGKPLLPTAPAGGTLHFNLGHSDGLALIAVTRHCPVGVDIERIRPLSETGEIAGHFFSPPEAGALEAVPRSQRTEAFFSLWTRKEAWLKALGEGITGALGTVEIPSLPASHGQLIEFRGPPEATAGWRLYELSPAAGFKAALATRAEGVRLSCWRWPL
jgi:4'-phosphopantetheinyl transferase